MDKSVGVVRYVNQENRKIKRFLVFILAVLGVSVLASSFLFAHITWVLGIGFFYLLTLELILIHSESS